MTNTYEYDKYDDVFTSILENEKSILGFLSAIFNFLARRTDFYYIAKNPGDNMGFPPGVAEELVLKVLRKCDPKNWYSGIDKQSDINNEIMCSTVAQEVEVIAEDNETSSEDVDKDVLNTSEHSPSESQDNISKKDVRTIFPEDYEPPIIVTQKNSEAYNGAARENYSWSQTIMDLGKQSCNVYNYLFLQHFLYEIPKLFVDVTVKLPPDIKSSKDLRVVINSGDIYVANRNGNVVIKDTLPFKIKTIDSFWSVSEGRLLIHLEKKQERWWNKFLNGEEEIDLSKIDCSRPLDELPEDNIAKVRELQWNQEQKLKGLPTSDEIRNMEVLKKAWNAEGSPFKGQEFNPNVLMK